MAETEKKRGIRVPHVYTIILALMAIFAVMTWLVPSGSFERQEVNGREVTVAGTYEPIDKVYTEISRVLATPAMQERLKTLGAEPVQSNPQSFAASLPAELAHWKKVVDESGAKID